MYNKRRDINVIGTTAFSVKRTPFTTTTTKAMTTTIPMATTITPPTPPPTTTTTTTPAPTATLYNPFTTQQAPQIITIPTGGDGGGGGGSAPAESQAPSNNVEDTDNDGSDSSFVSGYDSVGKPTHKNWGRVKSYSRKANKVHTHQRRVSGIGSPTPMNPLDRGVYPRGSFDLSIIDANGKLKDGLTADQLLNYDAYAGEDGLTLHTLPDATSALLPDKYVKYDFIGSIYSWLNPNQGGADSNTWWQIALPTGGYGYILWNADNALSKEMIEKQAQEVLLADIDPDTGVRSDKEKNDPSIFDNIKSVALWGGGIAAGLILLSSVTRKAK